MCDGSTACLDLYLGKLWCSISEFTASEKAPLPACSSYNVFQMTSCPTWSFVCSVVRRTSVSQFLHRQHASLTLHRPKRMWIWMKRFIICLIEHSLEEGSALVMSSVHASMGPVDACFNARFKNCNNFYGRKKEKYGHKKGFHS